MVPVATDHARWGEPTRHTLAGFLALDRLSSGLHLIGHGGLELPMLVANRQARATFVGFAAAMNPEKRRPLPFFQGRRIAPRALNMLLLSDPSLGLDESVRVGWFLGSREFGLPAILPQVLDHADRLMRAERRLLWGVSAGGTAALAYAREGDTAVAVNPQIAVEHFTRGRWLPWLRHGWGIEGAAAERAFLAEHADLSRRPMRGRVVYVQNRSDEHVRTHLAPYLATHGLSGDPGDSGRFRLILGNWGEGHVPPPPADQAAILRDEAARLVRQRGLFSRLRQALPKLR